MNNIDKQNLNINEPCIQDVFIRSTGEADVCFTTKDGQDETKLFLKEGEDVMFTVNFGDTSTIGFGGTDNWGKDRLPIYLKSAKDSVDYDSVFVHTIEIQQYAGEGNWCKCELINGNRNVKYTALTANPSNKERVAYFYHKTNDKVVGMGDNEGRPVSKQWCVTIIQKAGEGVPDEPKEDEKSQESSQDASKLGKYKYSVANVTDLHICDCNDNKTPNDTSDDWCDEEDFTAVMDICVNDPNVKFITSCGDLAESQTNAYKRHPEATCDRDYAAFKTMYDVPYWQTTGLRFFSPLGNHDFYGLFESRSGDIIVKGRNSETQAGYNASVSERISKLWPTDSKINGIVPGRGRIVFELENGKHTAQGQADMSFFAYNGHVDLYARQGGYAGTSIWDSNKGGISDEAIRCAKQYVNSNWNAVKDTLSGWNASGLHGRNNYSKLNYWLKKDDEIYIFLSVDYGDDIWGVNDSWHDRMIHARTIIDLNSDDPYIRRMKEYVADTGYSSFDEKYNYQYYSPNTLIWLKEIVENNTDKKIFVYSHHPLPNRVGSSLGIPQNGDWSYAVIDKAGVLTSEGINKGSNTLTGIEFWFINKLLNEHKNVVFFTGHSHISYDNGYHVDNHDYDIVSPASDTSYVYSKLNNIPKCESGWTVALPSLSKPRYITSEQKSSRAYDDAEMTIMEVYENGVRLKGYKVRSKNRNVYDKDKPLMDKIIILK